MTLKLTALMKTVTGKALVGLLVATTSVGAAAAAGVPVPVVGPAPADHQEADEPADDPGDAGEAVEDQQDDEQKDDEQSAAVESAGATDTQLVGDTEQTDGEDPNHGEVVSQFTQTVGETLGLTGCAKGQATAAVARGDAVPDSDTFIEDLAPFVAKCGVDLLADQAAADGEAPPADEPLSAADAKAAFHDAQAAYDDACGDDEADDQAVEGDAVADDTDPEMSAECQALKQAAKDAHAEWKDAQRAERDAAKAARDAAKAARMEGKGKPESAGKPEGAGNGRGK